MSKTSKNFVKVVGVEFDNEHDKMIRVECPYCNLIHKHSGYGLRQSSCYPGGFYYIIKDAND